MVVEGVKIMIGLSSGEIIRQAGFLPHFMGLQKPDNTLTITVSGQSPASSRNTIAEQALINECTHVFFIDDDMMLPPDVLFKLLAHDKDIVSALYLLRTFPHLPAFFDVAFDNGFNKYAFLDSNMEVGLQKGVNAGLGCVLIKTEVFKTLEKPWVRLGEIIKDGWFDDIGFFNRCVKAGFDVYCDTATPVGHMMTATLWPEKHGDKWFTCYKHANGNIMFPQQIPTEAEVEADKEKNLAQSAELAKVAEPVLST